MHGETVKNDWFMCKKCCVTIQFKCSLYMSCRCRSVHILWLCRSHRHHHWLMRWPWPCTALCSSRYNTLVSYPWWKHVDFGRGTGAALQDT